MLHWYSVLIVSFVTDLYVQDPCVFLFLGVCRLNRVRHSCKVSSASSRNIFRVLWVCTEYMMQDSIRCGANMRFTAHHTPAQFMHNVTPNEPALTELHCPRYIPEPDIDTVKHVSIHRGTVEPPLCA